jgi:hypothetical protein
MIFTAGWWVVISKFACGVQKARVRLGGVGKCRCHSY